MTDTRADRLRKARKAAGFISASEAARSLGVSPSTYIHHENGTRDFDETAANLYSRRYRVSLAWLLLGDGSMDDEQLANEREEAFEKKQAEEQEYREARAALTPEDRQIERDVAQRYKDKVSLEILQSMSLIPEILPTFERDKLVIRGYWQRYVSLEDLVAHPVVATWGIPKKHLQYEFGAVPAKTIAFPISGSVNAPTLNHGDLVLVDTSVDTMLEDGLYLISDHTGYPQVRRLNINLFSDPRTLTVSTESAPNNKNVTQESSVNIIGRVVGRITRM